MLFVKQYKNSTIAIGFLLVLMGLFIFLIFACNTKKQQLASAQGVKNANALIDLGRYLFYDRRLSINNTKACGTCHNPVFAFTDGYKKSVGAYGDILLHNTLPLFNLASAKYFTWSDSSLHTVYQQMHNPMFNQHPIEMGIKGNEQVILQQLYADTLYKKMFASAFNVATISVLQMQLAIGSFILTIKSNQSTYDKYVSGDTAVFSDVEKKGMTLFYSTKYACNTCHGGSNFNTPTIKDSLGNVQYYYNIEANTLLNKEENKGLYQLTKQIKDWGKYRVPTLRNLAFTAPYYHDGSLVTLQDVVYKKMNDKSTEPFLSLKLAADKKAMLAFLLTLTDTSFIHHLNYQNPFIEDETIHTRLK
jgi:cytochrome c peroxidase